MISVFHKIFSKKKEEISDVPGFDSLAAAMSSLHEQGFAVVNLLDNDTFIRFQTAAKLYLEEIKQKHVDIEFFSLGRSEHADLRNKAKELIALYLKEGLTRCIGEENYEAIYGTFLLKSNSDNSILNPHQDASHVNEMLFHSYHLWCPVTNPSPDFGTLQVIPFSHKFDIPYRSLNIPWTLANHEKYLWRYMREVHLTPGQAILFDSRLIHASGKNATREMRIAVNSLIKPVKADFIHCFSDETSNWKQIEIYKIEPDFFYNENIMERPKGYPLLDKVENTNKEYTARELDALLKSYGA